jgi:hypothetical protein
MADRSNEQWLADLRSSGTQASLSVWLQRVVAANDDEIDCDELAVTIEVAVEAAARGENVRTALPAIAVHLDQCPDCQEWFDTLVGLAREGEGP